MDREEPDGILALERGLGLLVAGGAARGEPAHEAAEGEHAGGLERPRGVEDLQEVGDARLSLGVEGVGRDDLRLDVEPLDEGRRREAVPRLV